MDKAFQESRSKTIRDVEDTSISCNRLTEHGVTTTGATQYVYRCLAKKKDGTGSVTGAEAAAPTIKEEDAAADDDDAGDIESALGVGKLEESESAELLSSEEDDDDDHDVPPTAKGRPASGTSTGDCGGGDEDSDE